MTEGVCVCVRVSRRERAGIPVSRTHFCVVKQSRSCRELLDGGRRVAAVACLGAVWVGRARCVWGLARLKEGREQRCGTTESSLVSCRVFFLRRSAGLLIPVNLRELSLSYYFFFWHRRTGGRSLCQEALLTSVARVVASGILGALQVRGGRGRTLLRSGRKQASGWEKTGRRGCAAEQPRRSAPDARSKKDAWMRLSLPHAAVICGKLLSNLPGLPVES